MGVRVAMVTGSYPPDACGVGDYTAHLVEALREDNCEVDVFTACDFKALNAARLAREISARGPDVVHIQYPTAGYGARLGPQILSLLAPRCVVTLHEVSQVNPLRRLSLYPFSLRACRIIFTTEYEKDYAARFAPWISGRSSVIPIGSAIPSGTSHTGKDLDDIVHFGLIRPRKGIEEVLELARLIRAASLPWRVRVVGMVEPRFLPYLQGLQNASKDLPVTWDLGLPEDQVALLLARAKVAYMPFPDGASERRSSLLALLANSVVTVTTMGSFTPREMAGAVEYAATPEDALLQVVDILSNTAKRSRLIEAMQQYVRRREWPQIAARHEALYRDVLQGRS